MAGTPAACLARAAGGAGLTQAPVHGDTPLPEDLSAATDRAARALRRWRCWAVGRAPQATVPPLGWRALRAAMAADPALSRRRSAESWGAPAVSAAGRVA